MRQGQQNRRGRGRNNNGGGGGGGGNNNNQHRKGQNPLTRSFESNGPDMKIRGTPAHIAEKYIALARDAHSAGDPVLAENYLQHAEHYNRIILAYREQQMSQGGGDVARPRPAQLHEPMDEDGGAEDDGPIDPAEAPQPQIRHAEGQQQPQRIYDHQQRYEQPRERNDRSDNRTDNRNDRSDNRNDRQPRFGQDGQPLRRPNRDRFDRADRERAERGERGFQGGGRFSNDRFAGDRPERGAESGPVERAERPERAAFDRPQHERGDRPERGMMAERAPAEQRLPDAAAAPDADAQPPRSEAPRRRERFAQSAHEQPEFLRRPVRRPRRDAAPVDDTPEAGPPPATVVADENGRD